MGSTYKKNNEQDWSAVNSSARIHHKYTDVSLFQENEQQQPKKKYKK